MGNGFFDREAGRFQYCVEDEAVASMTSNGRVEAPKTGAGAGQGRRSPRNLARPTLGEYLQAQIPGAKVASVSAKDRAAIGMGGRSNGSVLWWDKLGAGFVTSTWYADSLPSWVNEWNATWLERAGGWEWVPSLPDNVEELGTAPDKRPGERPFGTRGTELPYTLGDSSSPARLAGEVYQTPLVDSFTAEMGRVALRELELGMDDATDLLVAAARTGKPVNVKKGQFLAPWDMANVVKKVTDSGGEAVMVTERGTSFGYGRLVVDMAGLRDTGETGHPVIFDATHSVQRPGALGDRTGGDRTLVPLLARAAVATGEVHGLFMETHPDPDSSPSDGPNMVLLDHMPAVLDELMAVHAAV